MCFCSKEIQLRYLMSTYLYVQTLLNEQQAEEGVESDKRTLQKDEEIENILTRLNDFIEERER